MRATVVFASLFVLVGGIDSFLFYEWKSHGFESTQTLFANVLASISIGLWVGRRLYRKFICNTIDASIKLQADAIKKYQPDVIVGSSWGGAIAVFCLMQNLWKGPTLLLAPAQYKIIKHSKYLDRNQVVLPSDVHVHIVHGTKDATITPDDSLLLSQKVSSSSKIRPKLNMIEGDDHRLNGSASSVSIKQWIDAVVAAHQRSFIPTPQTQ